MKALANLVVRETHGIARHGEAIRIGVPLPRGALLDAGKALLIGEAGVTVPAQANALALWPDRSIKWLLVDACVSCAPNASSRFTLQQLAGTPATGGIEVRLSNGGVRVDTGRAVFEILHAGSAALASVCVDGRSSLDAQGVAVHATDARGARCAVRFDRTLVQERGAVRTTVLRDGVLEARGRELARLALRLDFVRDSATVRIECEIWNPRAARHAGGLWDLGDPGSIHFLDLSLEARPARPMQRLEWQSEPGQWHEAGSQAWLLYQDSSGGERWNSPNHIDARGNSTVSFRGFRVHGADGRLLAEGERATPAVRLSGADGAIAASVEKFWQNFPKALRCTDGALGIGLFPAECSAGFELQGGERKRHTVLLDFAATPDSPAVAALHRPLEVALDAAEVAASRAAGQLVTEAEDTNRAHVEYVAGILHGRHSFLQKRELIDEYGWRNFGDLYADHEAVRHQGAEPFVSHYNNQYDFVYGAALNFLRSGDARWRELMADAARHHLDIDLYHTSEDRDAFNGGLFWHTDHYQPAATSTHRTYSRRNARGAYGGGPSNEHNYTSGLLLYHHLSGDARAREAVLHLADWVLGIDDGGATLWGLIDPGPTGMATATVEPTFQRAGRGAGNSINALLDAYATSTHRPYLHKAEEFIQRCIHPLDDIEALGLLEPEHRWSYLVFLQVLCKYLGQKRELGEFDHAFHYARESLLHYARWVALREVPYKDVLHKVLLPTETWPAQDIRKAHVLQAASWYASADERAAWQARARFFFDRSLADLLTFPTAHLTRPQVLLGVYACQYAGALRGEPVEVRAHNYSFGQPQAFVTQRQRLAAQLRARLWITWRELGRAFSGALAGLRNRIRP